jgi:hypothetical protein
MSFRIKAFYDKFNVSHTGTIIGEFVASLSCAAVVMHILILASGAEGAWYLFVYFVIRASLAAVLSYRTIRSKFLWMMV